MAAGTYNIDLEQGATYSKQFLWQTSGQPPTPIDLTGCTARMQIRTSIDAPDPPILELTTENSGIVLGDDNGTIDVLITATQTAGLQFATGVYDLEIETASGFVTRLLKGAVSLDKEVTR